MQTVTVFAINDTNDNGWLETKEWIMLDDSLRALLMAHSAILVSPINHKNYLTGFVATVDTGVIEDLRIAASGIASAFDLRKIHVCQETIE